MHTNAKIPKDLLIMTEQDSTRPQTASLAEHFRRPQLFLAVLSAVTFIVYSVSLSFEFVWDDRVLIVDNPLIRSWKNLPQALSADLWMHVNHGQAYYRPLFTVWSMLNYSLFKLNPWGWHLSAILLHLIAVLAVYDLARRLRIPYWPSVIAVTIFALHPIHIESVAWISGVQDVPMAVFYVFAFTAFLRAREPEQARRTLWMSVSLLLLVCALLSKEMAVTFSAVVGLYVWIFPGGASTTGLMSRSRQSLRAATPYALLTLAYLGLRYYLLGSIVHSPQNPTSTGEVVLTVPYFVAFYMVKWLAPLGLTAFYYLKNLTSANLGLFALSSAGILAYTASIWYWLRKQGDKMLAFVAIWPLLTLTVVLNLPALENGNAVHDRYAYLPSVGLALLTSFAISQLPSIGSVPVPLLQKCIVTVLVLGMVAGGVQQVQWNNEKALFERGYALYPQNPNAQLALARVLRDSDPQRSVELLKKNIASDPARAKSYLLLADVDSRLGNIDEGRWALEAGVARLKDPLKGDVDAADLVGLYGRLGELMKGQEVCAQLLANPSVVWSAWLNCGIINVQTGRYAEAERLLVMAASGAPSNPAPVYWLGRAHLLLGRPKQAQQDFVKVLAMNPYVPDTHFWLGQTLEAESDLSAARSQYQEALRLDPTFKEARTRFDQIQQPPATPVAAHAAR